MRGHALGLERERLPEHLHGLVELAALCERRAEVRVRPRVFRVERDRLPQRRNALGKVRAVEEHNAEPVVGFGGIRRHFHRMLQPFERACILSALEICHAERDVDLRIVGILRKRLLHLRHGIRRGLGLRPGRTCLTRVLSLASAGSGDQQHGNVRGGGKTTWAHRSGSIRRSCRREDASSSSPSVAEAGRYGPAEQGSALPEPLRWLGRAAACVGRL